MKKVYVLFLKQGSKKLFVNKHGNLGSFSKCQLFENKREAKDWKRREEKIALVEIKFLK